MSSIKLGRTTLLTIVPRSAPAEQATDHTKVLQIAPPRKRNNPFLRSRCLTLTACFSFAFGRAAFTGRWLSFYTVWRYLRLRLLEVICDSSNTLPPTDIMHACVNTVSLLQNWTTFVGKSAFSVIRQGEHIDCVCFECTPFELTQKPHWKESFCPLASSTFS